MAVKDDEQRHEATTTRRFRAGSLIAWVGLGAMIGGIVGVASALLLKLLELVTALRTHDERIVYALPVAGLLVGHAYERWGKSVQGGSSLVIETFHARGPKLPLRMAPMVLIGTVLTHLFGGSAGREGTAVQMGATIADAIAHRFRVSKETRRQLLAAGIAGGFGSVFGTPIAGTLFGLEVVVVGRMEYDALVPAAVAAIVGDFVTRRLGVVHTAYPTIAPVVLTPRVVLALSVIGLAMALATFVFIELTHRLKDALRARIVSLPLRMFAGGLAVVVMWKLVGTSDYLGLGVPTIVRAFQDPRLPWFAFAAKLVFTAVTLSAGFLGGEVTPLFFVGATLGSVLARGLGLPIELGAGVGLAAVFGAAANTPISLAIMAAELLGGAALAPAFIVCVVAYLFSGHRGIYPTQRLVRPKLGGHPFTTPATLDDYRAAFAKGPPSARSTKPENQRDRKRRR